jgi:excisionase family DNA binding protein
MQKAKNLTVTETARIMKCTVKYVYDMIRDGSLEASKHEGKWRISESAVQKRIARRHRSATSKINGGAQ